MDWQVASQVGGAAGAIVGIVAFFQAQSAVFEARRSANAAERSADAAEVSLALQREESAVAEAARMNAAVATVEPIRWETSNRVERDRRGIQFKNYGPAVARDFRGVFTHGAGYLQVERALIAKDELVAFLDGYVPWTPSGGEEAPAIAGERETAARAWWKNADGSSGDSGWRVVPRR